MEGALGGARINWLHVPREADTTCGLKGSDFFPHRLQVQDIILRNVVCQLRLGFADNLAESAAELVRGPLLRDEVVGLPIARCECVHRALATIHDWGWREDVDVCQHLCDARPLPAVHTKWRDVLKAHSACVEVQVRLAEERLEKSSHMNLQVITNVLVVLGATGDEPIEAAVDAIARNGNSVLHARCKKAVHVACLIVHATWPICHVPVKVTEAAHELISLRNHLQEQ